MKQNFKRREHGRGHGRGKSNPNDNERRPAPAYHAEKIYIYGKHALAEALTSMVATRRAIVRKVFLSAEAREDEELVTLLQRAAVTPEVLKTPRDAERMAEKTIGHDAAHQGVIATIDTAALVQDFRDFAAQFTQEWLRSAASDRTMLVLLDELTDPHNVGAIIRSAAAFGAAGVLIPSHNQAPITGAVVKASAGMTFRIPLVSIANVNQAVDELRRLSFVTYGLAMEGAQSLIEEKFAGPSLIIVGNEGSGIRQKTLERCDVRLRIPMDARTESLNASVSAAITMYAWSVRHGMEE